MNGVDFAKSNWIRGQKIWYKEQGKNAVQGIIVSIYRSSGKEIDKIGFLDPEPNFEYVIPKEFWLKEIQIGEQR